MNYIFIEKIKNNKLDINLNIQADLKNNISYQYILNNINNIQ